MEDTHVLYAMISAAEISGTDEEDQTILVGL
jgi:hypothetical protein